MASDFILVCTEPKKWLTITYVPPGTKIKDKMVYAATKSTLLKELGFQYFSDELHANDPNELSWENYSGTLKPSNAYSASEIASQNVHKEEEEERQWRIEQQRNRGGGGRGLPGNAVASAARGRSLGVPAPKAGSRSSGFHSVTLPFSDTAKANVGKFSRGEANFVELAVNGAKDGVDSPAAETISGGLGPKLSDTDPRFYLFKFRGQNLFLYCCPAKAARPLRMVYSTSKGSVAEQVEGCGVRIAKSLEVSEASDVTDAALSEALNPPRATYSSASSQPSWANRGRGRGNRPLSSSGDMVGAGNAHPIYSMMGTQSNSGRKKIVLPPRGAW